VENAFVKVESPAIPTFNSREWDDLKYISHYSWWLQFANAPCLVRLLTVTTSLRPAFIVPISYTWMCAWIHADLSRVKKVVTLHAMTKHDRSAGSCPRS
jgi:hypothetical protein